MTAPTEAEIRAAVAAAITANTVTDDAVKDALGRLTGLLWDTDDLRPSEREALDERLDGLLPAYRDYSAAYLRQLAKAELDAFARDFPDAPRPAA
jgi:hypothetical protein